MAGRCGDSQGRAAQRRQKAPTCSLCTHPVGCHRTLPLPCSGPVPRPCGGSRAQQGAARDPEAGGWPATEGCPPACLPTCPPATPALLAAVLHLCCSSSWMPPRLQVLRLTKGWDIARDHVRKAVETDVQLRVYHPGGSPCRLRKAVLLLVCAQPGAQACLARARGCRCCSAPHSRSGAAAAAH